MVVRVVVVVMVVVVVDVAVALLLLLLGSQLLPRAVARKRAVQKY